MISPQKKLLVSLLGLFCSVIFCNYIILTKEIELLYVKGAPGVFYTSPTSKNIAIFSDSRKIMLMEPENGNIICFKRLEMASSKESDIFFISIVDTISKLIVGYKNKSKGITVEINNFQTGQLEKKLYLANDTIVKGDISPDCKYFATIDNNFNGKIFDLETGNVIYDVKNDYDVNFLAYNLKFSNNSKRIAIIGGNKIIIVSLVNKIVEKEIPNISYHIHKVSFSNSDEYLLKYNYESNVDVFEVSSGNKIMSLYNPSRVGNVLFVGNDEVLVAQSGANAYFWKFFEGNLIDSLNNIGYFPINKLYIGGEEYLVAGHPDNLTLWNLRTRKLEKILSHTISSSHFVDSGKSFVSDTKLFSTLTGAFVRNIGNQKRYYLSSLSNLGYFYVNDTIFWVDLYSNAIVDKYYFPIIGYGSTLTFSDDFKFFYYLDSSNTLKIYDWTTKKVCVTIENPFPMLYKGYPVLGLYSKNNSYFATIVTDSINSINKRLCVFSLKNTQRVFELDTSTTSVLSFAFSYDERYFFFRNAEGPVHQINLESGKLIQTFEHLGIQGETRPLQLVSFPNSPWLALSSDKSSNIIIFDYEMGKTVAVLDDSEIGIGSDGLNSLKSLDISVDGQYLLAEYGDALLMRRILEASSADGDNYSDYSVFSKESKISIKYNGEIVEIQINSNLFNWCEIWVFDFMGRNVYSQVLSYNGTPFEINFKQIPTGIYLLKVKLETLMENYLLPIIKY